MYKNIGVNKHPRCTQTPCISTPVHLTVARGRRAAQKCQGWCYRHSCSPTDARGKRLHPRARRDKCQQNPNEARNRMPPRQPPRQNRNRFRGISISQRYPAPPLHSLSYSPVRLCSCASPFRCVSSPRRTDPRTKSR